MISPDKQVWLSDGEVLSAGEVLEGFVRLAMADSSFPILSRDDRLKAAIALAFQAVDLFEETEE